MNNTLDFSKFKFHRMFNVPFLFNAYVEICDCCSCTYPLLVPILFLFSFNIPLGAVISLKMSAIIGFENRASRERTKKKFAVSLIFLSISIELPSYEEIDVPVLFDTGDSDSRCGVLASLAAAARKLAATRSMCWFFLAAMILASTTSLLLFRTPELCSVGAFSCEIGVSVDRNNAVAGSILRSMGVIVTASLLFRTEMSTDALVYVGVRLPAGNVGDCAFGLALVVVADATDTAVGGDDLSRGVFCCVP